MTGHLKTKDSAHMDTWGHLQGEQQTDQTNFQIALTPTKLHIATFLTQIQK